MGVRVLIVDPQPFFCEALLAALEGTSIQPIGWACDEREARGLTEQLDPDVVLTEVELRNGSGLSLTRRLKDRTKVVVLTRHDESDVLLDVVDAGAQGCLSHEVGLARLPVLLADAASGAFVIDRERLHATLKSVSKSRSASPLARPGLGVLTPREREILQILSKGLDNDAIARRLHLSTHTIRTHVSNILRKLEVHSRADAARIALAASPKDQSRVLRIEGPKLG